MKRLITISIIILLLPLVVIAHPGSLDSNGGHYNRKTGEYHYHSGEHQYGSSSSTTQTYYSSTPKPTVTPTQTPATKQAVATTVEPKERFSLGWKIFCFICLFLCLGFPGIFILIALGSWVMEGFMFIINWIKEKICNGKSITAVQTQPQKKTAIIPNGYVIGPDGLPYKSNREYGWGREFNVFVTNNGKHFHRSRCKIVKGKKKKLMHRYTAIFKKYTPCAYCNPKNRIDDWYLKYKGADSGGRQLSFEE